MRCLDKVAAHTYGRRSRRRLRANGRDQYHRRRPSSLLTFSSVASRVARARRRRLQRGRTPLFRVSWYFLRPQRVILQRTRRWPHVYMSAMCAASVPLLSGTAAKRAIRNRLRAIASAACACVPPPCPAAVTRRRDSAGLAQRTQLERRPHVVGQTAADTTERAASCTIDRSPRTSVRGEGCLGGPSAPNRDVRRAL